jgi:hypothetical protein
MFSWASSAAFVIDAAKFQAGKKSIISAYPVEAGQDAWSRCNGIQNHLLVILNVEYPYAAPPM